MRKIILGALATLFLVGGAFGTQAAPGPNGSNDKGLCTAFFNGQKNGHGDGEDAPNQPKPFEGLETVGRAYTDDDDVDNDKDGQTDEAGENSSLTAAENIFNYCNDNQLIGGNPEHGRFTCSDPGTEGPSTDPLSDPECENNEGPGNS